jgi:hypothetical protein
MPDGSAMLEAVMVGWRFYIVAKMEMGNGRL